MKTMRKQSGFTLIELMIVVAILAILMAIAIPAYQDYTIRAQVSEGMNLSGGARTAVAEYYTDRGTMPSDNDAAGLASADKITGEYIQSVTVEGGKITAKFGGDKVNTKISGKSLILDPSPDSGSIAWNCDSGGIDNKYLPARCRD